MAKGVKGFFQDFKAFVTKGNIIDMAVGVVIGGAFGKIVTSLVNDIITPVISLLTGKNTLTALKWVMKPEVLDEAGEITQAEVAMTYGNFIQNIVDFLIIAICIFIVLRVIMTVSNKLEAKKLEAAAAAKAEADAKAAEEAAAAKAAEDEKIAQENKITELKLTLLKEIRDAVVKK